MRPSSTDERGVALLLVIFIIALASILVINIVFSTNLSARTSAHAQRATQAEYILKSALNFTRVLLREDKSPEDSGKDSWGLFLNGQRVPPELLDLNEPNIDIELEIRPEESKIPLAALVPPASSIADAKWQGALTRLFQKLGFDSDKEEDTSGYFNGRSFNSEELVAILIDYMDADKKSHQPGGIESDLPEDVFPNQTIRRLSELSSVPGFTPARIRKLAPFVSAVNDFGSGSSQSFNRVNINVASAMVLSVLHDDIDDAMVQSILSFRNSEEGPFKGQDYAARMADILGDQTLYNEISSMIRERSTWFQVIAKVAYGNSSVYFLRAYVKKDNPGDLPDVYSLELF